MSRRRYVGLTALVGVLLAAQPASANTIVPTITADQYGTNPAQCSLREAVQAANDNTAFNGCPTGSPTGTDDIVLQGGSTYVLTIPFGSPGANSNGDLDVGSPVSINVTGSDGAIIDAGGATGAIDRVFQIGPGSLTASRLEIRGGLASTGTGGGINIFPNGTLTLADSLVTDNAVSGSSGQGGGIGSSGTVALTNVTLTDNQAAIDGGGIDQQGAGKSATLTNVTVSGNTADANVDGNGNGGGVSNFNSTLNLRNTVVANNTDASLSTSTIAPDCSHGSSVLVTSLGHNLIGNTAACDYAPGTGDLTNLPAMLGTLADNGGPTSTMALQTDSPAFNAGSPAIPGSGGDACAAADQRGIARPQGPRCDIGAFEIVVAAPPVDPPNNPPASPPSNRFTIGKVVRRRVMVTVPGAGAVRVEDAAAVTGGSRLASRRGKLALKPSSKVTSAAGTAAVPLRLTKPAKIKLKRRGKLKVRASVTYTPTGGTGSIQSKRLKVKR